jgi:hypothetical protein
LYEFRKQIQFSGSALFADRYLLLENSSDIAVLETERDSWHCYVFLGTSSKISYGSNPAYVVINRFSLVEGDPNRSRNRMDDYPPSEERKDEIILDLVRKEFNYRDPNSGELFKGLMERI